MSELTKNGIEKIVGTGFYQRSDMFRKGSMFLIIMGAVGVFFALLFFCLALSADILAVDGVSYYAISSHVVFCAFMLFMFFTMFTLMLGISNLKYSNKSEKKDYEHDGKRCEALVISVKEGVFVGEIGRVCPKCDAVLDPSTLSSCSKCGCELNSEPEEA